ncbi:MAG TPA: hypothetical protein VGQ48_13330 [Gemmatimonadales bacterium]|nr:hypothetical protein [Gemmatimonadales bacterium]
MDWRHAREGLGNSAEQQIHDPTVEQSEQKVELSPIGGARERGDFLGDAFAETRVAVRDERRCDCSQDG